MHELKRAQKITEQVRIGGDIIDVNIDIATVSNELFKRQHAINAAEAALKNDQGAASIEAYGDAIIELFKLIFGDGGTEKILAFYENNYFEMATEVMPFVINVVFPRINAERERLAAMYKSGQK